MLSNLEEAGIKDFAEGLDTTGQRVVARKADVTRSADCDATIDLCRETFGHADVPVTGAGLYLDQLVETMTDDQWHQTIAINLDGAFHFCCGRNGVAGRTRFRLPRARNAGPV